MSDQEANGCLVLIVAIACLVFGAVIGYTVADNRVSYHCQQQALEAGAKGWEIDPKTGNRSFNWGR
jgi:hypothetical protein